MDIIFLIEEYLKDKIELKHEFDCICIENNQITKWDFKNIPAPSLEELKALEAQVSQKQSQEKINAEAQAFLDSTDWMVIRALEKGEELSPELKAERQAARDRIVK